MASVKPRDERMEAGSVEVLMTVACPFCPFILPLDVPLLIMVGCLDCRKGTRDRIGCEIGIECVRDERAGFFNRSVGKRREERDDRPSERRGLATAARNEWELGNAHVIRGHPVTAVSPILRATDSSSYAHSELDLLAYPDK